MAPRLEGNELNKHGNTAVAKGFGPLSMDTSQALQHCFKKVKGLQMFLVIMTLRWDIFSQT